ncbi:glycine betaine ABC transporter substrate-binding protein [Phaeacidiphilus oryzae]|uniref:glycine betaine ABC transporter substrate-binding protein n=1 Tax=Phaeacidiphilus oryzae TaxID=348818 RepID=UPI00068C5619|nr:glycine betaine ABC transporter substrate-binding protein [Phaeacidiphilus oryzae]
MSGRARGRRRAGLLAAALLALLPAGVSGLSGCGLQSGEPIADTVRPGSVGKGEPLAGATLTVTSKNFSEQIILGEIIGLVFKAAGATVIDKTNIQGSIGARQAILKGTADALYDYTGTGWITYLGHTKPIADPQQQWQAVHDADLANGVTWLPQSDLNNTYALAVTARTQQETGVRTLSDVAALTRTDRGKVTLCVENEFAVRSDGLQGMEKAYGMDIPNGQVQKMDSGIVYTTLAGGHACRFGEVFTTDGRIPALNLKVLADDKKFFPNYNAAPVINSASLKRYPAIAGLLGPVTKKLTTELAQKLNGEVDVQGKDPRTVAKDWLVQEGFIKSG